MQMVHVPSIEVILARTTAEKAHGENAAPDKYPNLPTDGTELQMVAGFPVPSIEIIRARTTAEKAPADEAPAEEAAGEATQQTIHTNSGLHSDSAETHQL
jgi:hypothetical protein